MSQIFQRWRVALLNPFRAHFPLFTRPFRVNLCHSISQLQAVHMCVFTNPHWVQAPLHSPLNHQSDCPPPLWTQLTVGFGQRWLELADVEGNRSWGRTWWRTGQIPKTIICCNALKKIKIQNHNVCPATFLICLKVPVTWSDPGKLFYFSCAYTLYIKDRDSIVLQMIHVW